MRRPRVDREDDRAPGKGQSRPSKGLAYFSAIRRQARWKADLGLHDSLDGHGVGVGQGFRDPCAYLWRAVDHEGEVLEAYVTKTRDKTAALSLIKRAMKRYGKPRAVITDGLRSYGAAMRRSAVSIDRRPGAG